ncbi:MAG: hypothetical protein H0U24_04775, partial [Thermoleophilaceae bacterium]|nr:hypothetical protein [Thermoleophilaceae bacterium]
MRKIFVVLALTAVSAGVMAAPAAASHSWGTYHWARTANPFTLKVGNNVGSAWTDQLRTATSDWNSASVMDLETVAGGTTGRKCRATLGRIEV